MRKLFLTVILLLFHAYSFSQAKEFRFTPKWKVGDKRTLVMAQKETEYKNGVLVEDTTIVLSTEITILKENSDNYILKVQYENIALRAAVSFYEKLGDELPKYKNLDLKFQVNKQTGKAELINWKEAQKFMDDSFNQIHALLKKKAPEMSGLSELAFMPIQEMFKSKENIEAYMSSEIGMIFFPYNKKFILGDTLSTSESCANPFNPKDTVTQTTLSYLSNIDESKKTCNINSTEIFDLSGFKEMMTDMMKKMAKAFGASDSTSTKAKKEIEEIEFDVSNKSVITFDYNSTWPLKEVKTGKVIVNNPKGKSEKTVIKTTTVK